MFTESPQSLKNFIISKTYLEYAQWLLRDIENLISYSSKPVIASRYGEIEARFEAIQAIINKADEVNQSNSLKLQEPFRIHYAYTISFYAYEKYEFSRCMQEQDIEDIDFALVDIFRSAIETNTLYQSYLPPDHYESYLCKAACIESQAFIDSYQTNLLSSEGSLSNREGAAEAMDIFEKTFQMIDSDVYRKKEFQALCSTSKHLSIDHAAFNRFQKILKIYIASLYRESQTQLTLFLLIQEHSKNMANADISDDELSLAIESLEKFESKLVEVSACSVTTAIVLCEVTLKLSNSLDENLQLDMLRPASNFDELFNSLEYNYLSNLPVTMETL